MRLVIQDDADAVATWVSEYIVDRINAFKPTPTKPFVIGVLCVTRLYSSKDHVVPFQLTSCPPLYWPRQVCPLAAHPSTLTR